MSKPSELGRLGDLTASEWQKFSGVVLLPTGSVEQHGVHLPIATDIIIAEAVCEAACSVSDVLVVAPSLPYGVSYHHANLPGGALSLPPALYSELLASVITALLGDMPESRSVMVVNGHGGNWGSVMSAIDEMGRQHGELSIAACSWWGLVSDVIDEGRESEETSVGHAGELETSVVLAIARHLVREDRIPRGSARHGGKASALQGTPAVYRWSDFARHYPEGVSGFPKSARASFGAQVLEAAGQRLAELALDLTSDRDVRRNAKSC